MSSKQERIYGIDLLRIVSMLMVVALHILGQGGILKATECLSVNYNISWFIEISAYCAVNCYALISGYVGIYSKHKVSRLMMLWLQVAFYSIIISTIMYFTHECDGLEIIRACLPVTTYKYWYFTAYFAIWFFVPFMNVAIEHMSKKQAMLILICVAFVLLPIEMLTAPFGMNDGSGVLWLCYLYLIGAYISKHNLFQGTSCGKSFLVYLACIGLMFGYKLTENISWKKGSILINYISPFIFIAAIALLALFINIKIPTKNIKPISFVSALSFGVYLIHSHPLIYKFILKDKFVFVAQLNPLLLIATIIVGIIGIFAVCAFIDYLRICIFKLLKVRQMCSWIEVKAIKYVDLAMNKIFGIDN